MVGIIPGVPNEALISFSGLAGVLAYWRFETRKDLRQQIEKLEVQLQDAWEYNRKRDEDFHGAIVKQTEINNGLANAIQSILE